MLFSFTSWSKPCAWWLLLHIIRPISPLSDGGVVGSDGEVHSPGRKKKRRLEEETSAKKDSFDQVCVFMFMCVCACACTCVCVHARARVCVHACAHVVCNRYTHYHHVEIWC